MSAISILALHWLALPSAIAAPARVISYQGRVTDTNGQPIANFSDYKMQFRIYSTKADCDGDTGTNLLWTEVDDGGVGNPAAVAVTNGLFSVVLGTDTDVPLSMSFDADYWLGVKVDTDHDGLLTDETQFSPCDRLTGAPFTMNAINTGACSTDTICETQAISAAGNVYPSANNTYSSGTSALRWSTVYGVNADFSGNVTLGDAAGDTLTVYPGTFTWSGDADKTMSIANSATTRTLTINNPGVGSLNLTVEGTITGAGLASTGNTQLGDATGDTLTLYSGTLDWNVVDENKTVEIGSGAANRTLTITNTGAGVADLTVEGTVTATTFSGSFSGTATNSNACSADAICEVQSVQSTGNLTLDALNAGATSTVTVTNSNATYVANLSVEGAISGTNLTATGNTQVGDNAADTLTVYPGTFTWSGDADKTMSIANSATTRTLTVNNPGAGSLNLSVEGAISGTNLTATDNTQLGNATGDTLTLYSAIMDWNVVDENKTVELGSGATNRTLTITNTGAGVADLTVEGTVTATTFSGSFSGTATNSNACNADTACETDSIYDPGASAPINLNDADGILLGGPLGGNVCIGGGGTTGTAGTLGNTWRLCNSGAANSWLYLYNGNGSAYHDVAVGQFWANSTAYLNGQVNARGGIANDTASTALSLNDADGVTVGGPLNVTGGAIQVDGNTVIDDGAGWHRTYSATGWYNGTYGGGWYMADTGYIRAYPGTIPVRSDVGYYVGTDGVCIRKPFSTGGDTACPTSYAALTMTSGGGNNGNWATATDPGASRTGYIFCCWMGTWSP